MSIYHFFRAVVNLLVAGVSFVISWRFLERLPLLPIMAKDDQRHALALNQVQQFARAGAELLSVLKRHGFAIRGKEALKENSVDGQQHRAGLLQAHQHRLMSRRVPARLDQRQSGQQLSVSLHQPVAQRRMIPVRACASKAWMSAACQFVVLALDDEFRLQKGIVIARVVYVEMGTDQQIDIVRMQTKLGKMLKHTIFILSQRHSRWRRVFSSERAIDENVLPIAGLHKIAPRRPRRRLRSRRDGRGPKLHQIKSPWSCTVQCHSSILPCRQSDSQTE